MRTVERDAETTADRFELNLILAKVSRNRTSVFLIVLVALVIGLGYTFLSPPLYEAKTTVFFPTRASAVLGPSGVTEGSGGGSSLLGGGPSPLKIVRAFLESERALDAVEHQSGLPRKKLVDCRKITEDPTSNTLAMSIFLGEKDKAKAMLEQYLVSLGQINADLSIQSVSADTEALRQELLRQQEKLRKSETRLLAFQRQAVTSPMISGSSGGSPTPNIQASWGQQLLQVRIDLGTVKAKLSAALAKYRDVMGDPKSIPADLPPVRAIRPSLVQAEYQLKLSLQTLGPDSPVIRREMDGIQNLKDQLHSELKSYLESAQKGLTDPTQGSDSLTNMIQQKVALESEIEALQRLVKLAPDEARTLARLSREVSIDSQIVQQVTLQFQVAKLQGLRDPNKWSLLDPPRVFEEPVNKKYLLTGLLALLSGVILGLIWAINFGKRP